MLADCWRSECHRAGRGIEEYFAQRNAPCRPASRSRPWSPPGARRWKLARHRSWAWPSKSTPIPSAKRQTPKLADPPARPPAGTAPHVFRIRPSRSCFRNFPLARPFVCRTLRTTGWGESAVVEKIAAPLHRSVGGIGTGLLRVRWRSGCASGRARRKGRGHCQSSRRNYPPLLGSLNFAGGRCHVGINRRAICWPGKRKRSLWRSPARAD